MSSDTLVRSSVDFVQKFGRKTKIARIVRKHHLFFGISLTSRAARPRIPCKLAFRGHGYTGYRNGANCDTPFENEAVFPSSGPLAIFLLHLRGRISLSPFADEKVFPAKRSEGSASCMRTVEHDRHAIKAIMSVGVRQNASELLISVSSFRVLTRSYRRCTVNL